jgi:hypothetical protein
MLAQIGQAALQIGRLATVKGTTTWNYYTVSEATPSADSTITDVGERTLYIVQERVTQATQSLPDYPVGSIRWRVTAPSGTDIDEGAIVQSTTDSSLIFTLGPLSSVQGWVDGVATTAHPGTLGGMQDTAGALRERRLRSIRFLVST